jgi:hypothetical protein
MGPGETEMEQLTGVPPRCPFCDGVAVEHVGLWGGQIITAQWRCESCNSYFEAVREDFDETVPFNPQIR